MTKSFTDTLHLAEIDPTTEELLVELVGNVINSITQPDLLDTTDIVDLILLKIPDPVNILDADWYYAVAYSTIGQLVNEQMGRI